MRFGWVIDWPAVEHWAAVAQLVLAFLTFAATGVYVYFTYHIMKWAVGQGKVGIQLSELNVEDIRRQRARIDGDVRSFLLYALERTAIAQTLLREATTQSALIDALRNARFTSEELLNWWQDLATKDVSADIRTGMLLPVVSLSTVKNLVAHNAEHTHIDKQRERILAAFERVVPQWEAMQTKQYALLEVVTPPVAPESGSAGGSVSARPGSETPRR